MNLSENIESPLYSSELLKKEVLKWVNLKQLKSKDFTEPLKLDSTRKKLKQFTTNLSKTVSFDFNKRSICAIVEAHFKLTVDPSLIS